MQRCVCCCTYLLEYARQHAAAIQIEGKAVQLTDVGQVLANQVLQEHSNATSQQTRISCMPGAAQPQQPLQLLIWCALHTTR